MWARHIEAVIACWLGLSWIIFRGQYSTLMMVHDLICALIIVAASLCSYSERLRFSHLCNFLIGLLLIAQVFYSGTDISYGPHQNYMMVGMLLMMLSVVPARSKQPPRGWVRFLSTKKKA